MLILFCLCLIKEKLEFVNYFFIYKIGIEFLAI